MRRKKAWSRVLIVFVCVAAGALLLSWAMAGMYLSPVRYRSGLPLPNFQADSIPADGYAIPAWRGGSGREKFILVHGYGGNREYWSELAPRLAARGEVIVLATRGQDESPARTVGFGLGESEEIDAAAKMLKESNQHCRIHLVGVSQGGAACWIAAGRSPGRYASVTTEAAFARLDWAIDGFFSVRVKGVRTLFEPVIGLAELRSGTKRNAIRPFEYAEKFDGPSLILMSRDDEMFTERHADLLARATGGEPVWYEGMSHAEIFVREAEDVDRRIGLMIEKLKK